MPTGNSVASKPGIQFSAGRLRRKPLSGSAAGALIFVLYSRELHAAPPLATISAAAGEWLRPVLYGATSLMAFLAVRAVTHLISASVADTSNRVENEGAHTTVVEDFVEDAERLHIDPQIAHETFQRIASLIPADTSFGLHSELRGSLSLSEEQIDSLLATLSRLCDRLKPLVNTASVISVFELLQQLQSAPKSTSGQFRLRSLPQAQAATASPASPHADLQNASPRDSRFRTRAHFSGVKRRASDYSGPHRRATDRQPLEDYSGPLRRASDRQDAASAAADQRMGDRRSSERRAVVSQGNSEPAKQHRAVSADTSLLNQCLNPSPAKPDALEKDNISPSIKRPGLALPVAPLQQH